MLRPELRKTQLYFFSLSQAMLLFNILVLIWVISFTGSFFFPDSFPTWMLPPMLFSCLLPLGWAFVLYKLPKKLNWVSLIFPLMILIHFSRRLGELLTRSLLEFFVLAPMESLVFLPVSAIGIFRIIEETFNPPSKKKTYFLIFLGILFFLFIFTGYYLRYSGR